MAKCAYCDSEEVVTEYEPAYLGSTTYIETQHCLNCGEEWIDKENLELFKQAIFSMAETMGMPKDPDDEDKLQ